MPARVASSRSARTRAPRRRAPAAAEEIPAATSPAPEPSPPPPVTYTPLQDAIATIFQSAQKTTAGHRKLAITMRSIWEQCAAGTGPLGASIGGGRVGEKAFVKEFTGFLNRVLMTKKSEVVGDRCLRFTDLFVRGLLDKGGEDEQMIEEEEAVEETSAIRFVLRFIFYLLPLISSREKTVRYRTTQLLSLLLANALPEFPYDYSTKSNAIFKQLRSELLKRIKDKEAPVRVQAVVGVIKLLEMGVGTDEGDSEDDDEEGDGNVLAVLIEAMQNDPSADVRRTILYHINPTSETLPYLLERTRDTDPATRRSVFTRLLPSLGDFRHLSIGMREKLLRWGLNDRDESVREAARRMFNYRWLEDVDGDVIEILERLDVTCDGPQGGVKELALRGFWEERKDFVEKITFGDEFWEDLTAESAFLARSYNDYCRDLPSAQREAGEIDEKMPEVTKLALHLQKYLNKLVVALEGEDAEAATWEFVAEQLLMIASRMDYGDEIGRRKMFALLRESLAIPELPEGVTKLIVECLAKLSMGEGDFCMLILEVIAEVHDRIADDDDEAGVADESFHSAKSDVSDDDDLEDSITVRAASVKATVKELMINLKCLHIAQCMLENVSGSLKKNTHLVTMLNGLVVPAVRSHEAPVRERGLRCLGLSCLLDKTLAEENLTLFAHCFNKGHEALQIEALHIMSDILVTHGSAIFEGDSCAVEQRTLYRMFAKALKLDEVVEVQATATEVICKLMLAQVIKDEEVLTSFCQLLKVLVIAYFDSATADNQSLRQILTYFLPVYCHSRPENQTRMQKITLNTIHQLLLIRENLGEEEEMVSITTTTSQMVDWTDPRKNVGGGVQAGRSGIGEKIVDPNVHVDLAIDTLERVSSSSCNKEEKKVLCAMLGKLYIPAEATPEKLRELYELVTQAIGDKVATDAPSRNALNKLELLLGKIVNELERDGVTEATGDELAATGDEAEAVAGEATAGEASDDEGDDTIVMTKPPRVDDLASETSRETSAAPSTEAEEQEGEDGDEDEE
ncbi:nuclear condensing complex subunit [Tuber borchii]|uniref:Nuclear condensing complex subunit n=1 Tax=Tuber borchii TaxID=42251 RepID=A0A2T6ZQ76_TUBBO|nr:nuclear condensing complex subunit [Tuber borchii]